MANTTPLLDGGVNNQSSSVHVNISSESVRTTPTKSVLQKCLIAATQALGYGCLLLVALPTSVILLIILLLLVRVLQLFRSGDQYAKLVTIKHFICLGLFVCAIFILIGAIILFLFLKYVPSSCENWMFLQLPIIEWTVIVSIVCVIFMCTSFLYYTIHELVPKYIHQGFGLNVKQAASEVIDGLFFLLATNETMRHAPSLKHHMILGLPTQKWIVVSVLVLIGYNLIILLNRLLVFVLQKVCQRQRPNPNVHDSLWQLFLRRYIDVRYVVYYAKGMMEGINFMMSSLLLLLTWALYIGPNLDHPRVVTSDNDAKSLGIWTFGSLLVCSILWLIKDVVLLTWKARTLYDRLEVRILSMRKKSYFLGLLNSIGSNEEPTPDSRGDFIEKFISKSKDRSLQDIFMMQKHDEELNLDGIQQVSLYLFEARQELSKETYLVDLQHKYESRVQQSSNGSIDDNGLPELVEDFIRTQVDDTDREDVSSTDERREYLRRFFRELHNGPKFDFPYSEVQTWVERTHNQCVNLANIIDSAEELAECLNEIIRWLLIGAIFITWLLLTGLATTEVLVLVASPLLAATFIFGDTLKTLFQGIVHVFLVHPLDVGDLCVIEEKMLEVRSIGVWTTTFTKVDRVGKGKEMVIYSNSGLMTSKNIINYKTKFDWNDRVEFNLGPVKKVDADKKNQIIKFFMDYLNLENEQEEEKCLTSDKEEEETQVEPYKEEEEKDLNENNTEEHNNLEKKRFSFMARSLNLSVSAVEDSIMLVIRLEYEVKSTEEWTYSECLQKKDDLKGEFHLHVQDVVNMFKVKFRDTVSKDSHILEN